MKQRVEASAAAACCGLSGCIEAGAVARPDLCVFLEALC